MQEILTMEIFQIRKKQIGKSQNQRKILRHLNAINLIVLYWSGWLLK